MPDFIPILIGSLVVFIGLLLVFGGLIVPVSEEELTLKNYIIASDFTVSYTTGDDLLKSITDRTISSGIGSSVAEGVSFEIIKINDVTEGIIDLKVTDTNLYGPLLVNVNGHEVYSSYPRKGNHRIIFSSDYLDVNNDVDIYAGSSGWRFWAPTIYIFDANFTVSYYGRNTYETTFKLDEKPSDIEKAEIVVDVENRSGGRITIKINDAAIYSGYGTRATEFSKDYLKEGVNEVEVYTEESSTYDLDSIELKVWS